MPLWLRFILDICHLSKMARGTLTSPLTNSPIAAPEVDSGNIGEFFERVAYYPVVIFG